MEAQATGVGTVPRWPHLRRPARATRCALPMWRGGRGSLAGLKRPQAMPTLAVASSQNLLNAQLRPGDGFSKSESTVGAGAGRLAGCCVLLSTRNPLAGYCQVQVGAPKMQLLSLLGSNRP